MEVARERAKATSRKCTRKLDYNAPLLSTRRPSGVTNLNLSRTGSLGARRDTSERVPFSWEQTPGKPKNMEKTDDLHVPPPKPPPGKWHPPKERSVGAGGVDDGCDGDIDDDVFSDAIDLFSLSESVEMLRTFDKIEGFGSEMDYEVEEVCGAAHSPSFIIERFLTDASALAASSSCSRNVDKQQLSCTNNRVGLCVSEAAAATRADATQGCGLNSFLPWRMKHKPCGLKSPVRQGIISPKPQGAVRRKQNL